MERTIDGIDYIAKSEVLRIIDEEYSSGMSMIAFYGMNTTAYIEWKSYANAMRVLKERLHKLEGK